MPQVLGGNAVDDPPPANMRTALARYLEANAFINEGLIRHVAQPDPYNRSRRELMRELLPHIGHPERAFPAVHVTGTSGKGSVSTLLAHVLNASGLNTGLHVSPYVQVATEKLWVAGRYASAQMYADLVEWFRPLAEQRRAPDLPLHGLASVALCLEHFRRQRVDVAVIEAGVGGRRDITTVTNTKVAVITNVGWDHQKTLGPALRDIAWHKAGIIRRGCSAVIWAPSDEDPLVIAARKQADRVGASLRLVRPRDIAGDVDHEGRVHVSFFGRRLRLHDARLALSGRVQATNAALALAAAEELDPTGQWVTEESARVGLSRARLPARQEWISPEVDHAAPRPPCSILLDGAHNDDKLLALLEELDPRRFARIHMVHGTLHAKETSAAITAIARRLTSVVATEPKVYGKPARSAAEVATLWHAAHTPQVFVERDPDKALDHALNRAGPDDLIVVTGSFYLAGQLRDRWFPMERVVWERTSWPAEVKARP